MICCYWLLVELINQSQALNLRVGETMTVQPFVHPWNTEPDSPMLFDISHRFQV